MPNCWAAAWVLRLSLAKRNASALNASSYLRRLSGDALLFFAVMTQEIYVLILSTSLRPPQWEATLYYLLTRPPLPTAEPAPAVLERAFRSWWRGLDL